MDPPIVDLELIPEKEKIEEGKEGCPAFHCQLYDIEVIRKVADVLLPGLAAACVDNTIGGIFSSPGTVAVNLRKEMIEYLSQRSEGFVAESVILEGDPITELSDDTYDIISDLVDDFVSSKRNFFSRVSGWIMSEKREDKVDDFVQEMETNGFWSTDRRETVAQTLVKNVDLKNTCHCDKKFNTAEELTEHVVICDFRSMNCTNESCTAFFRASHMEKHDSVCPFKVIPCEQKCSDYIMRRQMDRHCITVCPMKLVNCPFYGLGCQSTVPRCMIQQHCSDELQSHLTYALKNIHKGVSEEDLKQRVNKMVQSSSSVLGAARDARSFTLGVRDLDAKLGPLEIHTAKKVTEESTESADDNTEKSVEPSGDEKSRSIEAANGNTDRSLEPSEKENIKYIEAANGNTDESNEIATESTDRSIKPSEDESRKSIEAAKGDTDESKVVIEESTEAATENTYKSIEPSEDENIKSVQAANNNTDKAVESSEEENRKSIEAESGNTVESKNVVEGSTEAANDKSIEPSEVENRKSMEAANESKVIEESTEAANDKSIEPSEVEHSKSEDPSETTNKGTSNLTAEASKEMNIQA